MCIIYRRMALGDRKGLIKPPTTTMTECRRFIDLWFPVAARRQLTSDLLLVVGTCTYTYNSRHTYIILPLALCKPLSQRPTTNARNLERATAREFFIYFLHADKWLRKTRDICVYTCRYV